MNYGTINNDSADITAGTDGILHNHGSVSDGTNHIMTSGNGIADNWITFDANGHGTAPAARYVSFNTVIDATNSIAPTNLPIAFVFDGWAADYYGDNPWALDTDTVTNSDTLYAKWRAFTYTVTFDANGHGFAPSTVPVTPGETTAEPAPLSETGYTFGGWFWRQDCAVGSAWNFATDTVTGDITLYAKWTAIKYTLDFDMQGHGTAIDPQQVSFGANAVEPTPPKVEGYTFGGWFTDDEYRNPWDFNSNTMPADDVILYAKWTVNQYTVTYDMNGLGYDNIVEDEDADPPQRVSISIRLPYGSLIPEFDSDATTPGIQPPTEPGYTFEGWFADPYDPNRTAWDFSTNTVPAGNTRVYAVWTANDYTATFDKASGSGGTDDVTVTFGETADAIEPPEWSGHTFVGYYSSTDGGATLDTQYYGYDGMASRAWDIPNDVTLYAKWLNGEANVFFNMNGYGAAPEPQIVAEGDKVAEPSDPASDVYRVFEGWYTDRDCSVGNEWDFNNDLVPSGTLTLYAKWRMLFAPVNFDANGHGAAPAGVVAGPGQLIGAMPTPGDPNTWERPLTSDGSSLFNSSLYDPITEGDEANSVTFVAWCKDASGTEEWDWDNDVMPSAGNLTLYAKWDVTKYAVTFDVQGHGTAPTTINVEWQAKLTKPTNPTATGYTFGGWFTSASCTTGDEWDFINDTMPAEDITLYAKWTRNAYRVTFDVQNHSASAAPASYLALYGDKVSRPADPTPQSGYTFLGWFKASTGNNVWNFNTDTVPASNLTIYAHWQKTGGSGSSSESGGGSSSESSGGSSSGSNGDNVGESHVNDSENSDVSESKNDGNADSSDKENATVSLGLDSYGEGLHIPPEPIIGEKEYDFGTGSIIFTVQSAQGDKFHEQSIVTINDADAAIRAILSKEDLERVANGESVEIRVTVNLIKHDAPEDDKALIEKGIKEFATAIEGLKLGEYLDITVEYRIGYEPWNAVTKTSAEIELCVELSEELRKDNAEEYYIIRAHEGALVLLFDTDKSPDTITFSTDRFSTYALSYTETPQDGAQENAHKCWLCGFCPEPLGICIFIWLLILIAAGVTIYFILKRKRENEKLAETVSGDNK